MSDVQHLVQIDGPVIISEKSVLKKAEPIHVFERNGKRLVVVRETSSWAIFDVDTFSFFNQFDGELTIAALSANNDINVEEVIAFAEQMFDAGLVIVDNQSRYEQKMFEHKAAQMRYPALGILHMHNFCNLHCKYCYIEIPGIPKESMQLETMKRAVSEMLELPNPYFVMEFHGGEPLISFDKIKETVTFGEEEAKKRGKVMEWSIQSNGTLITEEVAQFFKEHNFKIRISLDGPEELNDTNRVYHDGRGSYDNVIKGIRWLQKYNLSFCTVTVMSMSTIDRIDEIVDVLLAEGVTDIRLIPLFVGGLADTSMRMPPELWAKNELRVIKRIVEHNKKAGKKVVSMPNIEGGYVTNMFTKDRVYLCNMAPCGAAGGMANFAINGDVYPCEEMNEQQEWLIGNIYENSLKELLETAPAMERLRNRTPERLEGCDTCAFKYMCNGGCPNKTNLLYGTIDIRSDYCEYYMKMYEDLMWYTDEVEDWTQNI